MTDECQNEPPPLERTDEDIAVGFILQGLTDKRAAQELRRSEGFSASKARKLLTKAHKAISLQQARPVEWHRANFVMLAAEAQETQNYRVALEARKEVARLDRVHDLAKRIDIAMDGSPASARAVLVQVTMAALNGDISNNLVQALLPPLKALMGGADDDEDEEDLSRIEVGEMAVRDATARIMAMSRRRLRLVEGDDG